MTPRNHNWHDPELAELARKAAQLDLRMMATTPNFFGTPVFGDGVPTGPTTTWLSPLLIPVLTGAAGGTKIRKVGVSINDVSSATGSTGYLMSFDAVAVFWVPATGLSTIIPICKPLAFGGFSGNQSEHIFDEDDPFILASAQTLYGAVTNTQGGGTVLYAFGASG